MKVYTPQINSRFLTVLVICVCLAVSACAERKSRTEGTAQIEIELIFTGLWWSEDQMEGMNLSDAPPKLTEVALSRWEASDPIATPHPESVNVVALIKSTSDLEVTKLTLKGRWGIGGLNDSQVQRWTNWQPLADAGPIQLSANSQQRVVLATVVLDDIQEHHYLRNEWPWKLEAEVDAIVIVADSDLHTIATKHLEILIGD